MSIRTAINELRQSAQAIESDIQHPPGVKEPPEVERLRQAHARLMEVLRLLEEIERDTSMAAQLLRATPWREVSEPAMPGTAVAPPPPAWGGNRYQEG